MTSHGIDADLATGEGELVGEGDVDAAEGVLEKLGRLGDPRARGLEHAHGDVAVECRRELSAAPGDAADDLGDIGGGELAVTWIDALGEKARKTSVPTTSPTDSSRGWTTSSVVPGKVVLSSTRSWP